MENNVLYMAFYAMYWLAKEGIANGKITTLLSLLNNIGFLQHRSRTSLRDIFHTLGQQAENDLLRQNQDC